MINPDALEAGPYPKILSSEMCRRENRPAQGVLSGQRAEFSRNRMGGQAPSLLLNRPDYGTRCFMTACNNIDAGKCEI